MIQVEALQAAADELAALVRLGAPIRSDDDQALLTHAGPHGRSYHMVKFILYRYAVQSVS